MSSVPSPNHAHLYQLVLETSSTRSPQLPQSGSRVPPDEDGREDTPPPHILSSFHSIFLFSSLHTSPAHTLSGLLSSPYLSSSHTISSPYLSSSHTIWSPLHTSPAHTLSGLLSIHLQLTHYLPLQLTHYLVCSPLHTSPLLSIPLQLTYYLVSSPLLPSHAFCVHCGPQVSSLSIVAFCARCILP